MIHFCLAVAWLGKCSKNQLVLLEVCFTAAFYRASWHPLRWSWRWDCRNRGSTRGSCRACWWIPLKKSKLLQVTYFHLNTSSNHWTLVFFNLIIMLFHAAVHTKSIISWENTTMAPGNSVNVQSKKTSGKTTIDFLILLTDFLVKLISVVFQFCEWVSRLPAICFFISSLCL